VQRVVGALAVAALLAALVSFYVADRAGAGPARCQQHRADARDRTAIVTGEGERVLVIGDSWSVGLGQDDFSRSWPSRLAGEVHVAGFSGSGFSRRASGCGQVSFHDRAPTALAIRPDLVVVEGGLNDHDQPDAEIERGFRDLMADLAPYPVVVVGPADAPSRSSAVPRVDALLERLSTQYGVPYVRTSDLELDYLADRLHLTEGGHAEFGDAVAARIAGQTPARPAVFSH
jgi:acyl-CoA thioesterase-1